MMETGFSDHYETCAVQTVLQRSPKRTGLLGGTFNPVHVGHVEIAKQALSEFGLDSVVFLPLGKPPHKRNEYIAPAKDRCAMLELAIAGFPHMEVSRMEIEREGITYTVDTLRELKREEPETRFYFIIGSDTLFELETWREIKSVFKLCAFIAFYRPGRDISELMLQRAYLQDKYGAEIHLSLNTGVDVSSEEIRKKAARGESITGLVPDAVEFYILENGLYGGRI